MLVFDAVIYNEDRHFGNFGILRDNHSGKVIGSAPIFDNGMSLFNYAMPDDIENLDDYARTRSNPYGIPYETVCREVMGAKQKNQLHRLINFRFKRHESINLPEERLQAIEDHLQTIYRYKYFLYSHRTHHNERWHTGMSGLLCRHQQHSP